MLYVLKIFNYIPNKKLEEEEGKKVRDIVNSPMVLGVINVNQRIYYLADKTNI